MREFCTAGPIVAAQHYFVPPLERLDLPRLLRTIDRRQDLRIPTRRLTGVTTVLRALTPVLKQRGYRAVYCDVQTADRNPLAQDGIRTILSQLARAARFWLMMTLWLLHLSRRSPRPDRKRHCGRS